MTAERDTWVWIPMDSMRCANGSTGGFAVNLTDRSRELVLYLQGGGVCHNALTCSASLIDSVGDDPLRTAIDAGITGNRGIFDRADATNPFRNANFAVVPHCTGDHHTGDSVRTYGSRTVHHHGFANIGRVTERLLATFPDASRVTLSGFSAGGVGITGNYQRIAQSFEAIGAPTPLLVIDAGPFLRRPRLAAGSQADLTEAWNLEETVLRYCDECGEEGLHAFYRANARAHPQMRASLVCAYDDSVVKLMYTAIGSIVGAAALRDGLLELSERHADLAAMRFFFYPGDRHGALHLPSDATPGLWTFLNRQVDGSPDWSSVIP